MRAVTNMLGNRRELFRESCYYNIQRIILKIISRYSYILQTRITTTTPACEKSVNNIIYLYLSRRRRRQLLDNTAGPHGRRVRRGGKRKRVSPTLLSVVFSTIKLNINRFFFFFSFYSSPTNRYYNTLFFFFLLFILFSYTFLKKKILFFA